MSERAPFGSPATLRVVGYELEVRPCHGLWARAEGRVVRLVQSSGAEKPYRQHYLPDHGPASNGRTWTKTQPYWMRARTRERLTHKLRRVLNKHLERQRLERAERVPLTDTMAGWA